LSSSRSTIRGSTNQKQAVTSAARQASRGIGLVCAEQ
jgi:hypothetical protein